MNSRTCAVGLVLLVALIGCSDDDPTVPASGSGSVVIAPTPEDTNASWDLNGPNNYFTSGTGNMQIDDLDAGNYTISWGVVPGWGLPNPAIETKRLRAKQTLVFTGAYTQPGTITISPEPEHLGAPWEIFGPNQIVETGNGADTLMNMLAGSYSVLWGDVQYWQAPPSSTQTLDPGGHVTFSAAYIADELPPPPPPPGTTQPPLGIVVEPERADSP